MSDEYLDDLTPSLQQRRIIESNDIDWPEELEDLDVGERASEIWREDEDDDRFEADELVGY